MHLSIQGGRKHPDFPSGKKTASPEHDGHNPYKNCSTHTPTPCLYPNQGYKRSPSAQRGPFHQLSQSEKGKYQQLFKASLHRTERVRPWTLQQILEQLMQTFCFVIVFVQPQMLLWLSGVSDSATKPLVTTCCNRCLNPARCK